MFKTWKDSSIKHALLPTYFNVIINIIILCGNILPRNEKKCKN
jgi:hypothetical protein